MCIASLVSPWQLSRMHTCHAEGCTARVPPRMFMCRKHWAALDPTIQAAIWREYRPGQEKDKRPSLRYLAVSAYAVGRLAFKPNDEAAGDLVTRWLLFSEIARAESIGTGKGDPLAGVVKHDPVMTLDQARELRAKFGMSPASN